MIALDSIRPPLALNHYPFSLLDLSQEYSNLFVILQHLQIRRQSWFSNDFSPESSRTDLIGLHRRKSSFKGVVTGISLLVLEILLCLIIYHVSNLRFTNLQSCPLMNTSLQSIHFIQKTAYFLASLGAFCALEFRFLFAL